MARWGIYTYEGLTIAIPRNKLSSEDIEHDYCVINPIIAPCYGNLPRCVSTFPMNTDIVIRTNDLIAKVGLNDVVVNGVTYSSDSFEVQNASDLRNIILEFYRAPGGDYNPVVKQWLNSSNFSEAASNCFKNEDVDPNDKVYSTLVTGEWDFTD